MALAIWGKIVADFNIVISLLLLKILRIFFACVTNINSEVLNHLINVKQMYNTNCTCKDACMNTSGKYITLSAFH